MNRNAVMFNTFTDSSGSKVDVSLSNFRGGGNGSQSKSPIRNRTQTTDNITNRSVIETSGRDRQCLDTS